MNNSEAIQLIKEYNKTLNRISLSRLEKQLVNQIEEKQYFYFFNDDGIQIPDSAEKLIKANHSFKNLMSACGEKCCLYLRHMSEFTCNSGLIRMDARSENFSYYSHKALSAIGAFYFYCGAGLNLKNLIYGEYRNILGSGAFAPVIAAQLLSENQEAINYCKDVLLSENNTAVLTRDVIVAIEQSKNDELQDLLLKVFLNAKLQEGLRQSVIETADEGQITFFLKTIEAVNQENLIRFSSVQRGVLTWVGIGQEIVDDKLVKLVFNTIYENFNSRELVNERLNDDNPLFVYLSLYSIGVYNVDEAIKTAVSLLNSPKRHIIASALIYLKLTNQFDAIKYYTLLDDYFDDEWISSLLVSEITRLQLDKIKINNDIAVKLFDLLDKIASKQPQQKSVSSKGFEWFSITIHKMLIARSMYNLVKKLPQPSMIERMLPYVASCLYRSDLKDFMSDYFRLLPDNIKKEFMVKEIISQNEQLGDYIVEQYLKTDLTADDIIALEARLKTKKGRARALIISVIAAQSKENVKASVERLMASSSSIINECALELKKKAPEYFEDEKKPEIKVLGKEQGFGLYTPRHTVNLPYESRLVIKKKGFIKKKSICDLSFLQVMTKRQVLDYISLWENRIALHSKDEFTRFGEHSQVGDRYSFHPVDYSKRSLDALPLADVWRKYFEEDKLTADMIFQLRFYNACSGILISKFFPPEYEMFEIANADIEHLEYYTQYCTIINYYFFEFLEKNIYREKAAMLLELFNRHTLFNAYKDKNYNGEVIAKSFSGIDAFDFVYSCLSLESTSDDEFKKYFPIVYESYKVFNIEAKEEFLNKFYIQFLPLSRAALLGLIPQETLIECILDTHTINSNQYYGASYFDGNRLTQAYHDAYYENRSMFAKPMLELPKEHRDECDYLRKTLDLIADKLLLMESTRINEKTAVTPYVRSLKVVRGLKHVINALKVIENEELKRSSYGDDRASVFSDIIRNCYPKEGDNAEMLRIANIPEKRLVQLAMMAPQWIDIVSEVLGWDGFKEACYYFIAHMKQYDRDRKKAEIACYTDLNPDDLNDGAFDIAWCKRIYSKLGDKRMAAVYNASGFLCENSFHTRARKYVDACLGKTPKEEFLCQAKEKRNKDSLNAYCLCPIENEDDLLERFVYVQQFLKESKSFGAQRQASEKRACEIAMMNLARNSKYADETRMRWALEGRLVRSNDYALSPQSVGDIELWIEIDENGQNEIKISKNGKRLKSIPAKYKNDKTVIDIKNIHAMWTEQFRRSRAMLEKAMEERIAFSPDEIKTIMSNPIVAPMMSRLVLYSGAKFGFYENGTLKGISEDAPIDNEIKIAHPYDLYKAGIWHDYQKDIFNRKLVQPFKQVFRELYLKLDEELDKSATKRYSGYQIQPKKAAGALKSRGWNVSYESGLQRVCYKDNIIVNLFADADWFSPSDIEAPCIDYVLFSSRVDAKEITIKDVDDVLFSEIMRDLDMAVSVAYVGGVDPLTSYSTMELRSSIIEYTCALMKLDNVSVDGHFANIKGVLNDYSVHLGSTMIHQTGGSPIYVTSVYSEKRSSVFLPYLDDDPASAQLVSKIIMLAEDGKIKDPSILDQIITRK